MERSDREESAVLGGDGGLMTLQRKRILLEPADVPGLRHVLGVLTHAPAGDAVLHLGHEQADVTGRSFRSSPMRWPALRA